MKLQSEKVTVIGRGMYDDEKPEYGEFIRVVAPGEEGAPRRYSLDKSVNGQIKVGDEGCLLIESRMWATAHQKRNGELGVHYEEKLKVVGIAA